MKVRERLSSKNGKSEARGRDFDGAAILHNMVSHNPPIDVVTTLIEIDPKSVSVRDMRETLALHRAVSSGASKDVVMLLLSKNSDSISKTDTKHRTPLHCALKYACDNSAKKDDPALDIITALFQAAPSSTIVRDRSNETPIDIALRNGRNGPIANVLRDEMKHAMKRDSSLFRNDVDVEDFIPDTDEEDKQEKISELMHWSRKQSTRKFESGRRGLKML